ncbi:MAG TPA: DUF3352 domain-containing protein [Solirubrobacterales bacterium]|nr:DUF3352 domain-containing protein [Solirubrobacterales bacterium]
MKARLPATLFTLLVFGGFLLALAGCGDEGGGDDDGSQASALAPPGSPIFVEATIRPQGELKQNVEAVARTIGGIDDLGGEIVSKLESEAREDGEPFDFDTEVEPWLGERAGLFLRNGASDEEMAGGIALETTDPDAAQSFVEKQAEVEKDPVEDASYEGVEYQLESGEGEALGVVGDFLVLCDSEQIFKDVVDAHNGDSLDDEAAYQEAIDGAVEGSLADVYVDIGLLIEQSGDEVDPTALKAFESTGIKPEEATAVASVLPESDRVEVEISSDLGDQEAPSGDASGLLGSLPADSFAAFAVSGFGEQLQEALDQLDEEGIEGTVPPNQLKKGVREFGFDLDKIAASLDDAGLFASGTGEGNVGGAFVLTSDDSSEVATAIKTVGALVRQSGTPGVKGLSGKINGFAVSDAEELGPQPLVVATKGDRVAIGYGMRQTMSALEVGGGADLSTTPAYKAAVAALGDTPISGFVDGPRALKLADSLVPASDKAEFREAKKYLRNIASIALGSEADGNRVTAKLIVSLAK